MDYNLTGNIIVTYFGYNRYGSKCVRSFTCFVDEDVSIVTRVCTIEELAKAHGRLRFLFNIEVMNISKLD